MPETPDPTRTALIEAAVRVLIERGFDGATTKRIAKAAGVNEVTLFRRFGSKLALIKEAVRLEAEAIEDVASHVKGDLRADLEALVSAYASLAARRGRLIPVIIAAMSQHPELLEVAAGPKAVLAKVIALMTHHQAEGRLRPEPPMQAVLALIGPVVMAGVIGPIVPGFRLEPAQHVKRFLDGRATQKG